MRLTTSPHVHHAAEGGFAGFRIGDFLAHLVLAGDVLDADHQARFAGDGRAVGQPTRAAAHRFGDEIRAAGLGIGQEIADFLGQDIDGGEVAEGEIDARVIVVDGFGQVHDGNPLAARGQLFLEELELVGGLQGVVAADGNQGIDADREQGVVNRFEIFVAFGVLQMRGIGNVLARIGPRRADQNTLAVSSAFQNVLVDADVVAVFDQRDDPGQYSIRCE